MQQWGAYTASMAHTTSYTVTFATPFPNNVFQVVAYVTNTVSTNTTTVMCPLTAFTTTGFTFQYGSYNGSTNTTTLRYVAIGN